jgi:hypothetical protein
MSNEIIEAIREGDRVKRMRIGQNVADYATLLTNPEVRIAIVPLLERESEDAWSAAANQEVQNNQYGIEMRDKVLKRYTLFHALRTPGDVEQRVFSSPDELADTLDDIDVDHLMDEYRRIVDYSSPALDGLTPEMIEELKKAFVTIDLNALTGKQWWLVKELFMTLTAEQLPDKSLSLSSIQSLTGRNDEPESTPTA